ncbi:MAG: Uma2 family endonuclease [bacterium]
MPKVSEKSAPYAVFEGEFNMAPARDQHNEFVYEITAYFNQHFKGKEFIAKFDTFRYLEDGLIHAFGDFKNAIGLERFIAGLKRFGASKNFIKQKLDEFAAAGTLPPGYAPDVLVVKKTERHNRFSIPLLTIEIVSESSRVNDLYFKPYFYETLGVQEFFVGETQEEFGTIVRGYRMGKGQYHPIVAEHSGYYSEVIGHVIPQAWEL